jgi:flagellar biosynthesis GTPase FlhF
VKEKKKKPFYKRWWFITIVVLIIIGAFMQPSDEEKAQIEEEDAASQVKADEEKQKEDAEIAAKKEANEKEKKDKSEETKEEETTDANKNESEENNAEVGKDAVAALESNDFMKFTEEYKKLGTDKTSVWDSQLNGKVVTWTGTVVRAGSSQLFVYGGSDYNGETWDELADKEKLFHTFVAKYSEGSADEFKQLQTGDSVTVEGDLESRGDFELNFNWKIYNAKIKR